MFARIERDSYFNAEKLGDVGGEKALKSLPLPSLRIERALVDETTLERIDRSGVVPILARGLVIENAPWRSSSTLISPCERRGPPNRLLQRKEPQLFSPAEKRRNAGRWHCTV